jgi:hypothetical protein
MINSDIFLTLTNLHSAGVLLREHLQSSSGFGAQFGDQFLDLGSSFGRNLDSGSSGFSDGLLDGSFGGFSGDGSSGGGFRSRSSNSGWHFYFD